MLKKKILMVVKDHHEFKLLLNDYALDYLVSKYFVTVIVPSIDEAVKNSLKAKYNDLNFLDDWPAPATLRIKIYYWAKLQKHYFSNMSKSESCLQKSVINFFGSIGYLLGSKGFGISSARTITSNLMLRRFWETASYPLIMILQILLFVLRGSVKPALSGGKAEVYAYLVFGRPNSTDNLFFINASFALKKNKLKF